MAAKGGAVLAGAFRVPELPFFLMWLAVCLMAPLGGAPVQSLVWFALGAGVLHGVFFTALNALVSQAERGGAYAIGQLGGPCRGRSGGRDGRNDKENG